MLERIKKKQAKKRDGSWKENYIFTGMEYQEKSLKSLERKNTRQ